MTFKFTDANFQKEALEAFMEACGESVDGEVTHKKGFKDLFNKK